MAVTAKHQSPILLRGGAILGARRFAVRGLRPRPPVTFALLAFRPTGSHGPCLGGSKDGPRAPVRSRLRLAKPLRPRRAARGWAGDSSRRSARGRAEVRRCRVPVLSRLAARRVPHSDPQVAHLVAEVVLEVLQPRSFPNGGSDYEITDASVPQIGAHEAVQQVAGRSRSGVGGRAHHAGQHGAIVEDGHDAVNQRAAPRGRWRGSRLPAACPAEAPSA
jgi:hypothetical protein